VYETTVRLGIQTVTADAEGEVLTTCPVTCSVGQVVEVLDRFMGPIRQVPPMHSALKKDGKALYEYAREGETIEREARDVIIHALELLDMQLQGDTPHLHLRVACSKGTYIRALGCGGHLSALRRVQTGPFSAERCITLEQLEAMDENERMAALHPVDSLLKDHVLVTLDAANAGRFLSGMRRRGAWPDMPHVRVYGDAPRALLGTAHTQAGELIPIRLLSPLDIQQILESSPAAALA
jgi:tRNA pseudouridine55 synthase